MQISTKVRKQINTNLGHKPGEATTIIKLLNSKKRVELEQLVNEYRTKNILEVKRVHTKRNPMLQLENKC